MSKSINELLKSIGKGGKSIPVKEGELKNPDVPEPPDESLEIKDSFYMNFRTPSAPRNGAGYALPRQSLMNPYKESFMMDGAIDPNTIRNKVDPDSTRPNLSSQGKFSLMPESVADPHSQISLVKRARSSKMNYANRFQPKGAGEQSEPPPPSYKDSFKDPIYDPAIHEPTPPPSYEETTGNDTLPPSYPGVDDVNGSAPRYEDEPPPYNPNYGYFTPSTRMS